MKQIEQVHLFIKYARWAKKAAGLKKQQGITLVEIMIAMAIMLVVLAAVLNSVSVTLGSSIGQRNLSEIMERGQFALNMVSKEIKQAGYQDMLRVSKPGESKIRFKAYLRGCSNGIFNADATLNPSSLPITGNCLSTGNSDAIAIRYATGSRILQLPDGDVADGDLIPRDCLGNELKDDIYRQVDRGDNSGINVLIVDNRFYIKQKDGVGYLTCLGNGGTASQGKEAQIVQNIEHMQFWYGVSGTSQDDSGFDYVVGQTRGYMTSSQVVALSANNTDPLFDPWDLVSSVRVCVVVRSNSVVSGAPDSYVDCDGNRKTVTDGHLRRAMFTTVDLPNVGYGQ